MARKITPKQKKFADKYLELGNGTEAALAVYDVPEEKRNLAAVIASENLIKPVVANYLLEALPDELLAEKHKEGLEATYTDEWNEDKPDFAVRHRYLDTAYKLKGSYAAEKSVSLSANVSADEMRKLIIEGMQQFRGPTKP